MKKKIMPTLSENFDEIKQTWHQLKPQTCDPRSISKITFYANLRVDTEL